ncbi:PHP domain-containing protein [Dehalococcoidia bacterium]|nr:PHP domain-containing protein [Dehalococcoidia bacterium]
MLIDMHNHTSEGSEDSSISASDLFLIGKKCKLDGLCVTEHDSFRSKEAVEVASTATGLLAFQGIEVSTEKGHMLVYGVEPSLWDTESTLIETTWLCDVINGRDQISLTELRKAVESKLGIRTSWTAKEIIEETHRQGGCVALAHPFSYAGENRKTLHALLRQWVREINGPDNLSSFLQFVGENDRDLIWVLDSVDAIEVCGLSWIYENRMSCRLAAELGKPVVSGSDAHHASMVGLCATRFPDDLTSIDDLVQSIKDHRVQPLYL